MERQAINDAPSVAQDFSFFFFSLSIFCPRVVVLVDKGAKLCTKHFFFFFFGSPSLHSHFASVLHPSLDPRGGHIGGGLLKHS